MCKRGRTCYRRRSTCRLVLPRVTISKLWYTNLNLANSKDCWYRGAQGCYVFSNANNTKTHIGDEIDVAYTRMFADGKVALQAAYGTIFSWWLFDQHPEPDAKSALGLICRCG
jgi:hypothetical protein